MEFFDRKQDVLDIQLTPYGKLMLSQGKFTPKYYSFSDEDVVYDLSHSGITEKQKEVQDRIILSPRLKTQSNFTNFQSSSLQRENVISSYDREYSYFSTLGSSDSSEYVPSWNIQFLNSQISSSQEFLTSSLGFLPIPQINLKDLEIKTEVKKLRERDINQSIFDDFHGELSEEQCEVDDSDVFDDNTYFNLNVDSILMKVREENVILGKNDFEIEIFEDKNGSLIPLSFYKQGQNIVDDILLDEDEIEEIVIEKVGENDVQYYFDIEKDKELFYDRKVKEFRNPYNLPEPVERDNC